MTIDAPVGTDPAQFLTILPQIVNQANVDIAAVDAARLALAASGEVSSTKAVRADDTRLSDARVTKYTSLTAGQDFNTIVAAGAYLLSVIPTDWAAQHMPVNVRGVLEVLPFVGTANVTQRYTTWSSSPGPTVYVRSQASGVWGAWVVAGAKSEALTATSDFDTYTTAGRYSLAITPTDWAAQHMPVNVRGVLTVLGMNTTSAFIQQYETWEPTPRLFLRQYYSGSFGAWREVGADVPPPDVQPKPASGMKVVGVPVTVGHIGLDAPTTATVRLPVQYATPITRWRLVIRNINTRSGATRTGSADFTGVWFGPHSGAGAATSLTQVAGAFSVADTSAEFRTPWCNLPLDAGTEYLITYGYTASAAPWSMLGTVYTTASSADAGTLNPAGMTKVSDIPFTVAIEAETYSTTPVVASLGDSNSVGIGDTNIVRDSWLSQLCTRIKALPVHLGSSGDTCVGSQDGAGYKYTRFAGLAKPDCVIMALGQNDAAITNNTAATIEPQIDTVLANLAASVSDTIYAVNYLPRTTDPWAGFEALRRQLTTYLETLPGGIRDVFDIAAAISSDDDTITATYDSGDGTHLNAAGDGQVALAIDRPVTAPAITYA